MTKSHLKTLHVSGFRGASSPLTLSFASDSSLTMIYGENGSGKTTICDAFEFLAKGKVGSLDDRGIGSGLEKYYPSAGKTPADVTVKLESQGGVCEGRLNGKTAQISPVGSAPQIEILRQRQIAGLVEAKPADRYEAIKRFIDISEFEQSEKALSDLAKGLKAEEKAAKLSEGQSLDTLQGFFDAAGKPSGLNPVSWAKDRLANSSVNRDADISAIGRLRGAYLKLIDLPQRFEAAQKTFRDAESALETATIEFNAAALQVGTGANEILDVLEAGQRYLHVHSDPTECPLCSSAENAKELLTNIPARLEQLSVLRKTTSQKKTCETSLTTSTNSLQKIKEDHRLAVIGFREVLSGFEWKEGLRAPNVDIPEDIENLPTWLASTDDLQKAWQRKDEEWRGEKQFIAALNAAIEQYESNLRRSKELEGLVPRAESALAICIEERRKFTDGILSDIAEKVGQLYEMVHPGEGLDKIALPLDPGKRASLELKAEFSGREVPPQAYFSQSHLDTLGLCVFFALALRETPEEKILILDDVLGSVDEPHVDRVIQMVYETSKKFRHTIVTTHYRPWKEKYRWGALRPDQPFQFVELKRWSMGSGISTGDITPEISFLKAYLAADPIDHQTVCGKAGVILEALLDYLVQKYECSVPRKKDNRYTLGELLPAINGKLKSALVVAQVVDGVEGSRTSLKPILDELEKIVQVRNAAGAHFNEIAYHLPEDDGLSFARHVETLFDTIVHPNHGWPNNDKSGSYWRNSGDSRRLHPLKKPN